MKLISIGKMAKICNTSVQTLRFYDKKGILKASYQDPHSKYRYYEINQVFLFNIIKYLQASGMNLENISQIINNYQKSNTAPFWQDQEQIIQNKIKTLQHSLKLIQFQKNKSVELTFLQNNLNQIYVRKVDKMILSQSLQTPVTPNDYPDKEIAKLDQKIINHNLIPNPEYGFIFYGKKYNKLEQINYQSMFKELLENLTIRTSYNISHMNGEYLGIAFKWSREKYLFFYNKLRDMAITKYQLSDFLVIEESWPIKYSGKNTHFITELRIKIK
ncbi:MerR family transcriptional regulator [Lactobacillus sp. PSON]|uniref:MerR family transcriptional regulator n=1 Tax=Lactobacillus sp. PSON TaxID=3455454 RepID=UPI0040433962